MKYLRMTTEPDSESASRVFHLLAASADVSEARALDWTFAGAERVMVLFLVEGDRKQVRTALAEAPEVVETEFAAVGEGQFYLLLTVRPAVIPLMQDVFATATREGLLVIKPVVLRDGRAYFDLVGDPAALQGTVEAFPSMIDVTVHEIGEYARSIATAAAQLSDRQREAVRVALELGYYDVPRQATTDEVAEQLDCASSTASEHLRKAEATVMRAMREMSIEST